MRDIDLRRANLLALFSSLHRLTWHEDLAVLPRAEEHQDYREMAKAFHASGGIANSRQVTALLGEHTDQPIPLLARWIAAHEVLAFEWRGGTLLPLFQFDPATMAPHAAVARVVRELLPVLGEWAASLWFARPNAWLADRRPVDALAADPATVLQAARTLRHRAQMGVGRTALPPVA